MGTTTDEGKGFTEGTRISGEKPLDAASFRQQSTMASRQTPLNKGKWREANRCCQLQRAIYIG